MEDASAGPLLSAPRVAVVGGGWAGLAAAVTAVQRGWQVELFEASPHWGGRARSWPTADGLMLDNGQHVLLGAYTAVLGLMRTVGAAPEQAFDAHALNLRTPQGNGLRWPSYATRRVPAWAARAVGGAALLHAVLQAQGWTWSSRWAFLRTAQRWQAAGFAAPTSQTVAELCGHLPQQVMEGLITPLCVSALNIAPDRASAQVFLRVLQDGLLGEGWGDWSASAMLVPKRSLHDTLVAPALRWLAEHGAALHLGQTHGRVQALRHEDGRWHVRVAKPDGAPRSVDAVILACPAWEAARLTRTLAPQWAAQAEGLGHTAIATVYTWPLDRPDSSTNVLLTDHGPPPHPMITSVHALTDGPAQFVFCHPTHWAWVVSDVSMDRDALTAGIGRQAQAAGWARPLTVHRTVVEKRATWACTPDAQRPLPAVAAGLWAAGDWVDGPYPATLEGACRHGMAAAQALPLPA